MIRQPLYRPLTALVVRAPLLEATAFRRLGRQLDADLDRWWADPEVAFAVSVASPDLAAGLDAAPSAGQASQKARAALQRYLIRAATRPTPFGGFAAVGVARWAEHTDLELAPARRPSRTRADMEWLTEVAERLGRDPECRRSLRVYANTWAVEQGGRIFLTDPTTGGVRAGPDVSVRATPVVRRMLTHARNGIAAHELGQRVLAETPGATPDKIDQLLDELLSHQLLLPELLPALIGDPLGHLLKSLDAIKVVPAAAEWSARLTTVAAACRAVDDATAAATPRALAAVRALLATTPTGRGRRAPDVQVDTALPLSGTNVTRAIAEDVSRAVDVLFRLHPSPGWTSLAGYRAAFHRRYGDERRVPLLELLDPRFGLGAPSAHRGEPERDSGRGAHVADRRADTLRSLVATAMRDGGGEVVLDERLIERLTSGAPDVRRLPPSAELSVFVAAASRGALDRGDYLLVVGPNLGAEAAGRGLGRFADLIGPAAHDLVAEAAAAEESIMRAEESAAVVAELVYRPLRARSANVAVRPLVRGYELTAGVAPTLSPDRVVHADELSVELHDGRLRVWWDVLDRPLVLVAGHMLNSATAPAVCRALVELTCDGRIHLPGFEWGPMTKMPFLPRVRHGRVVLSPAQWRLGPGELGDGTAEFDEFLDSWRARWRVPRLVYLSSSDNRLLLDLDDSSHRAQLREAMRGARRPTVVSEALPDPDDAWLPGPHGRYLVELVVPVVRTRAAEPPSSQPAAGRAVTPMTWGDAQRLRSPRSDWLYFTLDGPRRTENELLAGSLGDLADGFVERGDANGWFFVRYADPDPQLRVRLHGSPHALVEQVLPELTGWAAAVIASGVRTRFGLQTYERELERYGGPETTAVCEALACVDSSAVRALLRATRLGSGRSEVDRVELGLVSAADLLASLVGDDSVERARWAKGLAGGANEGGAVFRERKIRLRALVQATDDGLRGDGGSWSTAGESWSRVGVLVAEVLSRRRAAMVPLAAELQTRWTDGTGFRSPEELAPSIVHLHANRLGLDRHDERLTLGLLDRTLRSLLAHQPRSRPERPSAQLGSREAGRE